MSDLSVNPTSNELKQSFFKYEGQVELDQFKDIFLYFCVYDKNNFHLELFELFNIKISSTLTNAIIKRKSEYLAGRYCARMALRNLDIYDVDIISGEYRAPIWPNGILGSISHTKSHAFAAVVCKENCSYLGIDYEKYLTLKVAKEIKSSIIDNSEMQLLLSTGLSYEQAVTLAFSAKESLFKALFPNVGRYFDFDAAKLVNISMKSNRFEFILQETLTEPLYKGLSFEGRFELKNSHVFTIVAM